MVSARFFASTWRSGGRKERRARRPLLRRWTVTLRTALLASVTARGQRQLGGTDDPALDHRDTFYRSASTPPPPQTRAARCPSRREATQPTKHRSDLPGYVSVARALFRQPRTACRSSPMRRANAASSDTGACARHQDRSTADAIRSTMRRSSFESFVATRSTTPSTRHLRAHEARAPFDGCRQRRALPRCRRFAIAQPTGPTTDLLCARARALPTHASLE